MRGLNKLSFLALFFLSPFIWAQDLINLSLPLEERKSLKEFIEAAEKNGYQLGEQSSKIEASIAREGFATSKHLPIGTAELLSGPIPGASGNAVDGTTDWDNWNLFFTAKIDLAIPLYSFGAVEKGREAAKAGTEAERQLLERERWALRTQVTELYYGYQLAFELREVAADLESKLNEALSSAEKKRKSSGDLEKIRSYLTEVKVKKSEAEKAMAKARMAMAWKIGVYGKSIPVWNHANLKMVEKNIADLKMLHEILESYRPELKALAQEVEARRSLADSEYLQGFPSLFIGGRLNYGYTPHREAQKSPFANDTFNTLSGGAALGLKMNLGFWERSAKVKQALAEATAADFKYRHLRMGMQVEVEKNWLDLKLAQDNLNMRSTESKEAKRLYRDAVLQYGLGTGGARELLERLGTYALSEKGRLESLYNFNINFAKLEQSVGKEL